MTLFARIKLLYPIFTAIILIIFSILPSGVFSGSFFPMVDVIIIYYWCMFYPSVMKGWLAFAIGILRDALSGTALGLNALAYLMLRNFSISKEENRKSLNNSFAFIWQKFALLVSMVAALKWLLFGVIFDVYVPFWPIVINVIVTVVAYPFFHMFFSMILSLMPKETANAK